MLELMSMFNSTCEDAVSRSVKIRNQFHVKVSVLS